LDRVVLDKLQLQPKQSHQLEAWNAFLKRFKNPKHQIKIGLVGKYVELQDSYKSILESLIHAGADQETEVEVVSLHSEEIDLGNVDEVFGELDGVLVAPGFGERGIEGKITAIEYARKHNLPLFRDLFGDANGSDRIRPESSGADRCQFYRDGS
jgi:CTP synthase